MVSIPGAWSAMAWHPVGLYFLEINQKKGRFSRKSCLAGQLFDPSLINFYSQFNPLTIFLGLKKKNQGKKKTNLHEGSSA